MHTRHLEQLIKRVEESTTCIKNHDVAKAKDEDVDFVQVWEEIQVAVNMVDEVGRETKYVLEDGREPAEVAIHEGVGVGVRTGNPSGGLK